MESQGITWTTFVERAAVLGSICDAVVVTSNSYKAAKLSESSAAREEGKVAAPAQRFLDSAFKSGSQQLIAASDHGTSLYRTLRTGPMLSFAPWTSAREVLEACATSLWLLDHCVTPLERYSRGLIAELQDIDSVARYFRRSGDLEMVSKYESDAQTLLHLATELGIEDKVRKCRRPNISKRIEETIGDSSIYAMLSPVAHGNPRMSLGLGTDQVLKSQSAMITGLTVQAANWLVTVPVRWIARTFWVQSELFGWDVAGIEAMLEREWDRAGFNESSRFWRR